MSKSSTAVPSVIPSPPAEFSPLAITRSGAWRSRSSGIAAASPARPGLPTTSPMKRTRITPAYPWDLVRPMGRGRLGSRRDPVARRDRHPSVAVLAARRKAPRRDQVVHHSRGELPVADRPEQREGLRVVQVTRVDVHPADGIDVLEVLKGKRPRWFARLPRARLP